MGITRRLRVGAAVLAAGMAMTACANTSGGSDDQIKVGIKFDQPGLGQQQGTKYTGFDVDLATYIAKKLGYKPDQIDFKEAVSANRETMLKNGDVDYIVGTYSITPERKQVVDFVGPYFVAHQDFLVRSDFKGLNKQTIKTKKFKLCSVQGSTSAADAKKSLAKKSELTTLKGYSECMDGLDNKTIDAVTTDDSILAGLQASKPDPSKYKLLGLKLTNENYGVGIPKDSDKKDKITDAVKSWISSGQWAKAAKKYFGPAHYKYDPAPKVQG